MPSVITAYSVEWVECSEVLAAMQGILEGLQHRRTLRQRNPIDSLMLTAAAAAADMVLEAVSRLLRTENMGRSWIRTTGDAFPLAPFAKH